MQGKVIHIRDVLADPEFTGIGYYSRGNYRSSLGVPLSKKGETIGVFVLARSEVREFTQKQIKLVTTFADQAVIAIENVRLFNELRERTGEAEKLNQHLEQRVADQVGEIERMSRLRRFLPPRVADLIVASGSEKPLESYSPAHDLYVATEGQETSPLTAGDTVGTRTILRTVADTASPKLIAKTRLRLVTPTTINRTAAPKRPPNKDLRTREHLTEAEVERL